MDIEKDSIYPMPPSPESPARLWSLGLLRVSLILAIMPSLLTKFGSLAYGTVDLAGLRLCSSDVKDTESFQC